MSSPRVRHSRRPSLLAALSTTLVVVTGCSIDETMLAPSCHDLRSMVLVAQSVSTARFVPCLDQLRSGWRTRTVHVDEDGTTLRLDLGSTGAGGATVAFTGSCDGTPSDPTASDVGGADSADVDVEVLTDGGRIYRFVGGCVKLLFDGRPATPSTAALTDSIRLIERSILNEDLRRTFVDEEL